MMIGRGIILVVLIGTFCGLSLAQQVQQPARSRAEDDVRKLERQWLEASEQNNAEAQGSIAADDFTIPFPNGTIQTKPQLMAMVKAPRRTAQPQMRFHTEDVRSRAYGDTVILIGR